jgi:pyruvate formate lyase activating enzyme
MKTAMYYEKANETDVRCMLCPHGCYLKPGQTGVCLARRNIDGELYSLNYGKITALALDPIEKKPLVNFHPGSYILSAGSFGCNLKCSFCQNWQISQAEPESDEITPEELVKKALALVKQGNIGIAYTYNEPSIWYEYVHDCSVLAHEKGLLNVFVTNGYILREPMEKLLPLTDAMNIDLKAFEPGFYSSVCKGKIDFVKETIRLCAEACHVEVTNLLIPGQNDSDDEVSALAGWLAELSPDITLHLTAYHPDYKMREPRPEGRERVFELVNIAKNSLKNVYAGNV